MEETQSILELLAKRLKIKLEEVSPLLHQLQKQVRRRSTNNVIGSEKAESIQGVFDSLCLMELDSFISNRLPLLNLPVEILEALKSGKIEYTKAKAIARIGDEENRIQLLKNAIANSLSLSQIRELVKVKQTPEQQPELKTRFDATYKRAKRAKSLWSNAKKKKQLESLLIRLEKLLNEEDS